MHNIDWFSSWQKKRDLTIPERLDVKYLPFASDRKLLLDSIAQIRYERSVYNSQPIRTVETW